MASDDGFLSRWSRRKVDAREGRVLQEPEIAPAPVTISPAVQAPQAQASPAPTLAQAEQLTPDADFTQFVARGVAPEVRNAAMKKLFSDPHFNIMDGLDIYIDDYSQPDPLPKAMLRQMASARTLNLFDETPPERALTQQPPVVAQSVPVDPPSNPEPPTHDHPDLRLQPDPNARP